MPESGEDVTKAEEGVTKGKGSQPGQGASRARPIERLKPGVEVRIRVERELRVALDELPLAVVDDVARLLTFGNPLHARMLRAGKLTPDVTRHLTCYWEGDGYLFMTRGFASRFVRILQVHRLTGIYEDCTRRPGRVYFEFKGDLYGYQKEAVEGVQVKRFGVITGEIGSGKKVITLYLMAERQVPALVIVQTRSQVYQWQEMAARFLGLGSSDIGVIGDGRQDRGRPLTIAISRSLHQMIDEVAESVGFLVVDQVDRAHLNVFFKFVRHIPSAYMFGLAIRRKRDDGLTQLMYAYMGPLLHEIDINRVYSESTVIRPVFQGQDTGFDYDFTGDYKEMVGALAIDPERNARIVTDVLAEAAARRDTRAVVLVERLIHLEALRKAFQANYRECALVSGKTKKNELPLIFEAFDKGKIQILCITAKSFNLLRVKRITHLFVASPLRHPEHLCQAVGKLLWAKPGDEPPRIYDYQDRPAHLQGSFRGRMRVYRDMGVEVED